MIIVTIELQSAITNKRSKLGVMHICNDGTGTVKRGNYFAHIMRKGSWNKPVRLGKVKDYPRASYSVWRLVMRALKDAFPEEK